MRKCISVAAGRPRVWKSLSSNRASRNFGTESQGIYSSFCPHLFPSIDDLYGPASLLHGRT